MIPETELTKMLRRCDNNPANFKALNAEQQAELKQFCKEIIKYGGITHAVAGGRVFTDKTLLLPAKKLLKSLKRKKEE